MILRCRCASAFQDAKYGEQMRVHNPTRKSDGKMWRCTACGSEQLGVVAKSTPDVKPSKKSKEKSKVDSGKKAKR